MWKSAAIRPDIKTGLEEQDHGIEEEGAIPSRHRRDGTCRDSAGKGCGRGGGPAAAAEPGSARRSPAGAGEASSGGSWATAAPTPTRRPKGERRPATSRPATGSFSPRCCRSGPGRNVRVFDETDETGCQLMVPSTGTDRVNWPERTTVASAVATTPRALSTSPAALGCSKDCRREYATASVPNPSPSVPRNLRLQNQKSRLFLVRIVYEIFSWVTYVFPLVIFGSIVVLFKFTSCRPLPWLVPEPTAAATMSRWRKWSPQAVVIPPGSTDENEKVWLGAKPCSKIIKKSHTKTR